MLTSSRASIRSSGTAIAAENILPATSGRLQAGPVGNSHEAPQNLRRDGPSSQTAEAALRLDRPAGPPGSPGISTMTLRPQHIFMICHPGTLSYFLRRNERDSDPDYRRE